MREAGSREETGLRIVFLGTPECAVPTLRAVLAAGYPVPLVVTRPDRRRGRGGTKGPSPVKVAALEAGIPVLQPEDVNSEVALASLEDSRPDVVLIVAYGKILRDPVLAVSRLLPVNLHFSLLPEYRGAAPVARAVADGKTVTGVTVQRIVRKLDAGPVLASVEVPIGPEETAAELMNRLALVGADLTVETLAKIQAGTFTETPQDHDLATLAPMLRKEEGRIDWTRSADDLHCHVRAMDPWPGATTELTTAARGKATPVTVVRCRRGPEDDTGRRPGEVTAVTKAEILVQTGVGQLALTRVKPAGKNALTARELSNGYRVAPGDRFGA